MKGEYSLPYDYTRCDGSFKSGELERTCVDCMRRLSPGRENWQSYVCAKPDDNGHCDVKISFKQWKEQ